MKNSIILLFLALTPQFLFSQLSVNFASVNNPLCFGDSNGSLTLEISGGLEPYSITWFNGSNNLAIDNLSAGTYCVTVSDAALNEVEICQTLTEPLPISYDIQVINGDVCAGISNGAVSIQNIQGGTIYPNNCGINNGLACTSAEDSLNVGAGLAFNANTEYPAIFGNWFWGARHQMIYLAEELLEAGVQPGLIKGIGLHVSANSGTPYYYGFTISMKCSQIPDLSMDWESDLETVFTASSYVTIQSGWNYFDFPEAYYWNGVDNLVVGTCFNNGTYTNNASTPYTTTAFVSTRYFYSDMSNVCNVSNSSTTSNNRPNMTFINCSAGDPIDYLVTWSNNTIGKDNINLEPGTYTFEIEDYYGCSAEGEVSIIERPNPVVNLGPDSVICLDQIPFILDAGNSGATYQWNTEETTQTIEVTSTDFYIVLVTNEWDCQSVDKVQITVENCYTGIDELENQANIQLFPNPSNGQIQVLLDFEPSVTSKIMILDMQGKVVLELHAIERNNTIDLSSLESGVYQLILIDKQSVIHEKIMLKRE
jgi:hypothetical protein